MPICVLHITTTCRNIRNWDKIGSVLENSPVKEAPVVKETSTDNMFDSWLNITVLFDSDNVYACQVLFMQGEQVTELMFDEY